MNQPQKFKTPGADAFDPAVLARPHLKRGKPVEGRRLRTLLAKRIRGTARRNQQGKGLKKQKAA